MSLSAAELALAAKMAQVRSDFPVLNQEISENPLAYLDNAATTPKPNAVIEAVAKHYRLNNANVHRGVHTLSARASAAYEAARERIARHLNAAPEEIIFVRGATEGINLVAQAFVRQRLEAGDEILLSQMEHHANIVPWQLLRGPSGAKIKVAAMDELGTLDLNDLASKIGPKTRFISITHVSNALGTINPVAAITKLARQHEIPILIDGAQGLPHMPVDVKALGCDFYVFSGHKLFGPSGVGALYVNSKRYPEMLPYQGGGDMILSVSFEETVFNEPPFKYEAGTPNIEGAIGLAAALDYLDEVGWEDIEAWEKVLLRELTASLESIPGLTIVGQSPNKAAVLSFVMEGVHPHDIGTFADQFGVAIRAGHHCAQPTIEALGYPATARASLAFVNNLKDIDALTRALEMVKEVFG